jgi:hypothetical protein
MLACQELLFFPTALTLYPGMPLAGWEWSSQTPFLGLGE